MSRNQSRGDNKNEPPQYRRSGRSGQFAPTRNFSGGGPAKGGGGDAGIHPSSSSVPTNRSGKKVNNNAQSRAGGGGGSNVSANANVNSNLDSSSSYAAHAAVQNGAHPQQPPLCADVPVTGATVKPTDAATQKSTRGVPKAPAANVPVARLDATASSTTAKAPADQSKSFPLQFGSISPGFVNGMQIPAQTNSAPSPGRVVDRPASGPRLDRRPSFANEDDKWSKLPGPIAQGRDLQLDIGYGGNVQGFRPSPRGNFGVLRNPCSQTPVQYAGGILSGPMQSPSPQGGVQRNNMDSDCWQRSTSFERGLIPSPKTLLQVMHKAERKYEVGKITDEEEAKQRQLKGILNKLTPQNFDKLFEQVKQVNFDNASTLFGVIAQIFDKALMEPTFCEMYANICHYLAAELPDFSEDNEKITFKRLLLNKCQEEFERGEREQEEANRTEEESEVKQTEEQREEKRIKARRRMMGNIRFIGELYKKKMLTERVMHECIKKLLGEYENPDEEDVEALCKLISTIGEMIDHPNAKEHMDVYFDMMFKLSNNMKLSSRVRFMLKDSIDLRKNKWQQRMKVEGPKNIEEVHRDDAPVTGATVKPADAATQKSTRGVPKAPVANVPAARFDPTASSTPSKAPPDPSNSFPLQFGSISPGFLNGMQIPARTNSASQNLDEQKRDQARHDSIRGGTSTFPTPIPPKQQLPKRKNKWQRRREVEGPKKIEEVHRDAALERQAQSSWLAREPSLSSSGRRGQPPDFAPSRSNALPSLNAQMSSFNGLSQPLRGYGNQDAWFEEGHGFENRPLSVPLRPVGDDSIALGPQGGLARGMSIRGQPLVPSIPLTDMPSPGDSRRVAAGPNGYGSVSERTAYGSREDHASRYAPERFVPPSSYDHSSLQERNMNYMNRDIRNVDRSFDRPPPTSPPARGKGPSLAQDVSSEKVWPEERLRIGSIEAIKEFYSIKDEKEVEQCIKDLNAPNFYPSMISIWVTDSFERKDMDRDLLAKLLINLAKSHDVMISQEQLVKGFESVLASLEDAVNDAPKAAESLGRIFAKVLLESALPFTDVWRLIHEGGEEEGRLVEIGLAAEVLGVILEVIKSERGDPFLTEMYAGSDLQLEKFRPPGSKKSLRIDKFISHDLRAPLKSY